MPPEDPTQDPYLQTSMPSGGGGKLWLIVSIVLAVLIIAGGIFAYVSYGNMQKTISSQKSEIESLNKKVSDLETQNAALEEQASNEGETQTDDELVEAAAKASCQAQVTTASKPFTFAISTTSSTSKKVIYTTNKTFAKVNATCSEGTTTESSIYILKKVNGNWVVIYSGTDDPTEEIVSQYAIPADSQFN